MIYLSVIMYPRYGILICRADFYWYIKIYLRFLSFLDSWSTQVVEILAGGKQGAVYPT